MHPIQKKENRRYGLSSSVYGFVIILDGSDIRLFLVTTTSIRYLMLSAYFMSVFRYGKEHFLSVEKVIVL